LGPTKAIPLNLILCNLLWCSFQAVSQLESLLAGALSSKAQRFLVFMHDRMASKLRKNHWYWIEFLKKAIMTNITVVQDQWGFHLGLQPFLNPLLILCYWVCVEVHLLCSLPITVCAAADSVVYQVTLLPSNNGPCHSEQSCVSGRSAPFLHW